MSYSAVTVGWEAHPTTKKKDFKRSPNPIKQKERLCHQTHHTHQERKQISHQKQRNKAVAVWATAQPFSWKHKYVWQTIFDRANSTLKPQKFALF